MIKKPTSVGFFIALALQPALFQKAIENNVLGATPTTLLTSLTIVRQLWRFEEQIAQLAWGCHRDECGCLHIFYQLIC